MTQLREQLHWARMKGTPIKAIQFALTLQPADAFLFLSQWNDASLKPQDWHDWIKFLKEHP